MKKRDGTGGGKMKEDQYLLSSVSNTLDILDLLNDHEELSLAEICKKLHMGKTSAFRMLYTLEAKQFVYKTPDAKYRLGMKFVQYLRAAGSHGAAASCSAKIARRKQRNLAFGDTC